MVQNQAHKALLRLSAEVDPLRGLDGGRNASGRASEYLQRLREPAHMQAMGQYCFVLGEVRNYYSGSNVRTGRHSGFYGATQSH